MKVITAPSKINFCGPVGYDQRPFVFLAGGITGCYNWQDEVIKELEDLDLGTLINPRRENFPIHDPSAARKQITWEFNALNNVDIFSMYFASGDSLQPICLYELGRNLVTFDEMGQSQDVLICVELGYKREQDVRIQTELVNKYIAKRITTNLEDHINNIRKAVKRLCRQR